METSSSSSILQLFRYADGKDVLFMILGVIGSIVEGMAQPLIMLVLGSTIDAYGDAGTSLSSSSPNDVSYYFKVQTAFCN